jgi:primosomal protein N'
MKKIILFICLAFSMASFNSCGDSETKVDDASLKKAQELEKQAQEKLDEANRLKEEQLAAEEEMIQREKTVERAKLERQFPDYSDVVIVTQRSYFHSNPSDEATTKKFLVNGDQTVVLKTRNGYGYVEFYNPAADKVTAGWLDLHDLEVLEYKGDY